MRSKWWLWVVGVLAAVLPAAAQTYPNLNARTVTVGIPGTTPMVFLSDTGITPQTSGGSALGPAMLFGTDTPTDGVSVTAAPNTFYLSSDGHTYWKVTGSGTTGWVKVLDCTVGASGGCILNLPQMTLGNNSPQLYDPYDGPGAPTGSTFAYEFAGAIGATLYRGFDLQTLWNPSATMTNDGQALISFGGIVGTHAASGGYRSVVGLMRSTTTGTVTAEAGGYFGVERSGGQTSAGQGLVIGNRAEAGSTIGANYGIEILTPVLVGGGAITNSYGLQLDDQTVAGATLSDAIKYDSPTANTFELRADGSMVGGLAVVGPGTDNTWPSGATTGFSVETDNSGQWTACKTSVSGGGKSAAMCEYEDNDGSYYWEVNGGTSYIGYDVTTSLWYIAGASVIDGIALPTADGTNHQVLMTNGSAVTSFGTVTFAELGSTPTTFSGYGISDTLANLLTAVSATRSGNTSELASASGAFVSGNCVKSDANHNLVDAGGACGGGGGSGTVTSVDMSVPTGFAIAGNPITTSGTLALTLSDETANSVMAGPTTGSAAPPTFRALVGADLPSPGASSLGGIESLASTSHKWINAISTAGVPSATQPAFSDLSSTPTTFSGYGISDSVANLMTAVSSGTSGSGNFALVTSPSFTTPALGTPSALVLTNATGLVTAGINASQVTLAKIQNAGANSVLVGSGASGSGSAYTEITLGTGLSMSGTTLNGSAGGSPGGSSGDVQCNISSAFAACDTGVFTYASHILTVNTINSNIASALTVAALAPAGSTGSAAGNALTMSASNATVGSGAGTSAGGAVSLTAGNAAGQTSGTAVGGAVTINGGNAVTFTSASASIGGAVTVTAGNGSAGASANGGTGGALNLNGGIGACGGLGCTGNGGTVTLTGGAPAGAGTGGAIALVGAAGTTLSTGGPGGAVTLTGGAISGSNSSTSGGVVIENGASGGASGVVSITSSGYSSASQNLNVITIQPGTNALAGANVNGDNGQGTLVSGGTGQAANNSGLGANSGAGGALSLSGGAGGAEGAAGSGGTTGAGGVSSLAGGAGGTSANNAAAAGAGGVSKVVGGVGGANTSNGSTGGAGGSAQLTGGAGGNSTGASGTRDGGNGGNVVITVGAGGTGASANGTPGLIQLAGTVTSTGTKPTISGCSAGTQTGGTMAGTFASGTSGTCSVTLTFTPAVATGFYCGAGVDITTPADSMPFTGGTSTTATFSGTTVSGDVIRWGCQSY